MLTFFTTAKPFEGHNGIIQRNALQSWKLLHPDIEIILFGNEEGTAEVAREMGARHEPQIECNEFGTPLLSYMFRRAQEISRYDWVCYSNADIIQTQEFRRAFERAVAWGRPLLMVGQRWDLDIAAPLEFSRPGWGEELTRTARARGLLRSQDWIDYFVLSRKLRLEMLPFAVGRPAWDNWTIWKVRSSGAPVLDATPSVVAIHQNHDYSHHPQGVQGSRFGEEFQRNRALVGSWRRLNTLADATHVLEAQAIRRTHRHLAAQAKREWQHAWMRTRTAVLDLTKPLRHRLGLRQETISRFKTALLGRQKP